MTKKPWVKIIVIGAAAILTICSFFMIFAVLSFLRGRRGDVTTTEPIITATHLTLPKSTRVLGGSYLFTANRIKGELIAKVSMPSTEALEFVKQPGFEPLALGDDVLPYYAEDRMKERGWSWGTRENAISTKTVLTENQEPGDATYCLLDRTNSQTTIVYIFRSW